MRVRVTGATGFIGRNALRAIASCRRADALPPGFACEIRQSQAQAEPRPLGFSWPRQSQS